MSHDPFRVKWVFWRPSPGLFDICHRMVFWVYPPTDALSGLALRGSSALGADAREDGGAVLWVVSVKLFTLYSLAKTTVTDRIARDERGEIGSWMILAAGLAVAAAAAVALLGPWFDEKANDITKN
jgi:hypothetical protein